MSNDIITEVFVIELNSFGMRSGAGLFSWDEVSDFQILMNGPLEFRII